MSLKAFIQAGERFGFMLAEERRFEARIGELQDIEHATKRLLEMNNQRCGVRNELDALAKDACAEVRRLGGDPAIITRAVVVAWNYNARWYDTWIETRAKLMALGQSSDDQPPISDTSAAILQEMQAIDADANNPVTAETLAGRFKWRSHKRKFDQLKKLGYVVGSHSGYHLTPSGIERAKTIN